MADKKTDEIAELRSGLAELAVRVAAQDKMLLDATAATQKLLELFGERVECTAGARVAPYVGEAVQFFTTERSRQTRGMQAGPYAALVLRVNPDSPSRECDLIVFSPSLQPMLVPAVVMGDATNFDRVGSDDEVPCWWQFPEQEQGRVQG